MIAVTFHYLHFLEDEIFEGDVPRDDIRSETFTTDDVHVAATWIKDEGLSFAATGTDWAADPDGSYVSNYATGERIESSAHIEGATDEEFAQIVDLVG